ncbi:paramyosin-like isoform X3 [Littorina saxatilis]|uniref:paramyosin-like isoform X3 n=1 Tax=Littorina saxatilis TaxID=31220 RepID=UPI0038B4A8FE
MSRMSSTFSKVSDLRSTPKYLGGAYLTDVDKTASKKQTMANSLRKSTGNMAEFSSMAKSMTKGGEAHSNIETEYIRNLQQQVYFLELEANYLREQARKAADTHPQMVQEADRMLSKLRLMQQEMDAMAIELQRKDSAIGILMAEKERLQEQIRDLAGKSRYMFSTVGERTYSTVGQRMCSSVDVRSKDKRLFTDEVVTLKTEKDRLERELSRKDAQLLEAKSSIDKSTVALTNAETKIHTLKAQLEQRIEQHKMTQLALDEKRSELVSMETQLREVEDKFYSSTVQIQDKVTEDLRDEIRHLRQKLKETEMNAEKDRYLRDKINEDSSHLVKENAALSQQVLELEKQLDRERGLRQSNEQRHSTSIGEVVSLRDKEGALRHEIDKLQEQLKHEQGKSKQYLEQLTNKEVYGNQTELKVNTLQSKVNELEALHQSSEADITQLKRDKVLLVEHVADLQKKIEEKDRNIIELRAEIATMDSHLKTADYQKSLELSAQSQKWEEFGRLAESMRTLSSTMAHSTTPRSKLQL